MQDNHYHGRLKIVEDIPANDFALFPEDPNATILATVRQPDSARRLKACWNALVGVDTALIEDGRLFAVLQPPAPFTAADTDGFMHQLNKIGWLDHTCHSAAPMQRLLNNLLQQHAPVARISQEVSSCSRTNNEQERSYQLHGADYKERMLAAFAFCRQLEIELTIARDLLRIHEAREATWPAPANPPGPLLTGEHGPGQSEGPKP